MKRASPGSSTICSATAGPCTGALISVEDKCIGIDEYDPPPIFGRFQRGRNLPENVVGSGIGLTSVEQIVHQHGGRVHIQSRLGSGTIVSVWLPVRRDGGPNPHP
ncbi:MAG: sensor histidine kinase [Chloroflexi bacterium]|nr:sensor histidine kinase [Chloroflexota bacterium]